MNFQHDYMVSFMAKKKYSTRGCNNIGLKVHKFIYTTDTTVQDKGSESFYFGAVKQVSVYTYRECTYYYTNRQTSQILSSY